MNASLSMNTLMAEASASGTPGSAQAGYGVSLNDVAAFEQALDRARGSAAQGFATAPVTITQGASLHPPGEAMQALFRPLEQINGQAAQLSAQVGCRS